MLVSAFVNSVFDSTEQMSHTHSDTPPRTDPFSKVPAADTHAEPDNNSYMDEI